MVYCLHAFLSFQLDVLLSLAQEKAQSSHVMIDSSKTPMESL